MRKVTSIEGHEWKVGRQWLPRRPKFRSKEDLGSGDWGDVSAGDDLGAVLIGIGLVVFVFVLLVIVFPVVVLALELILLAVLLVAGVVARVVFRKPWHVLARSGETAYRWPVKGWRASGERVREVADALASGTVPSGAERLKR